MYQPKTTLITIQVGMWTELTDASIDMRFSAARAVAVQIAHQCQMDMMAITYGGAGKEDCLTTVIYVNNGRSFADIRRMMAPQIRNYPQSYWMLLDIYEWQGTLECVVSVRGTHEEWSYEE